MKRAESTDNPHTKIRSLMLRTVGKRDIGQCEVSRLLMSEPLYHSSFTYVSQSLDLTGRQLDLDTNSNNLTKTNLLDFYADRFSNEFLKPYILTIINFLDFVTRFVVVKGQLRLRTNISLVVITTTPKVRYNKRDLKVYKMYCHYQIIKYSDWKREDIPGINNFEDSIERFERFILVASPEILAALK